MGTNREMNKIIIDTNSYYTIHTNAISKMKDEDAISYLREQTRLLKKELQDLIQKDKSKDEIEIKEQKALHKIMAKAYGLVKTASNFIIGESHYDVQIMGAIALNEGYIAEMGTGEGKTLTATMPAYLNALLGKGVHVVTPNNYLAARDYKKMSKVYRALGLSCGLVEEGPVSIETIEEKKKAYQADITYGSAAAFAFDYLFDSIETNKNRLVLRDEKPGFAIIDEADAVLFDDARVPFTISGDQIDERLAIDKDAKRKEIATQAEAIKATRLFAHKVKNLRHKEYSALMEVDNNGEYEKLDKEVALIVDVNTKEHVITTLGYATLFCHYKYDVITKILKKNNLTKLTMNQVINLVVNEEIEELTEAFNKYCGRELMMNYDAIIKGVTAWYLLEKDKDYTMNLSESGEYVVSPVINGRTVEKRKYSNGLQQAIEMKEKMSNPGIKIKPTKVNDTLASIPTSSFFARYNKLSGMTGTSIERPLSEMYNLQTYRIPPNKMKKVRDRGDIYFDSPAAKFDAIFKEVLESYRKGQPVLITTTSIAKSQQLGELLMKRLQEEGINIYIPILNANVKDIAEESKIIAKAGLPGRITISTEMAGRGTDIKLGGEKPTIAQSKMDVFDYYIRKKEEDMGRNLSPTEKRQMIQMLSGRETIAQLVEQTNKDQIQKTEEMKNEVIAAGGLKIIGSGHFKFTRIDNQVKGRCGRQGDVGEIIFLSDPSDLAEIGIPKSNVEMLGKIAKDNPYEETKERKLSVTGLIRKYQKNAEERQYASIKLEQDFEKDITQFRYIMFEESLRLKKEDDYLKNIGIYIREITKRIIKYSSPKKDNLSPKTYTPDAEINYNLLHEYALKVLGISIEKEDILKCRSVEDIEEKIISDVMRRLKDMRIKKYKTTTDQEIKIRVDQTLTRVWNNFEQLVERIREQFTADMMVGIDPKNNIKNYIGAAFDYSFETEVVDMLSSILNIHYGEDGKYLDHIREIEISPSDIRTMPIELEGQEADNSANKKMA